MNEYSSEDDNILKSEKEEEKVKLNGAIINSIKKKHLSLESGSIHGSQKEPAELEEIVKMFA